MEKIMTAAINVATMSERELTSDELDAVSGGSLNITKPLDAASPKLIDVGGGGGDAGPAIAAWNKLLGQYGLT
jgi:hypothetical protein